MSEVKVYIFDDGDGPYWADKPYSTVGDWLAYSEEHAYMIPDDQYQKWVKVRVMEMDIADEMRAYIGKG
jgi:hypothetical protein